MKNDIKKEFGKNVQKYRKLKKYTQERLAELIGVDVTSISAIETGRCFPSTENLARLSTALEVELSDFFVFGSNSTIEEMTEDIIKYTKILMVNKDSTRLTVILNYIKSIL